MDPPCSESQKPRVAREVVFFVVSAVGHALLAVLLMVIIGRSQQRRRPHSIVEVRIIKAARAAPPPAGSPAPSAPSPSQPIVDTRKPLRKLVIKPRNIMESHPSPKELPVPVASPQPAKTEAHGGVPGGIAGGVPGGVPGGGPGGAPTGEDLPVIGASFDADYLRNEPPKYPAVARRLRLEGTATIRVLVSAQGLPKQVKLQNSSGVQVLDEAALEAVQHWTFVPARRGNNPIPAEVDVPVRFRLDGTAAR